MSKEEEKRLTARLKKGDKDAFRQLFESLFPVFLSFARKLLRDRTIAEDLVQNVFMRIWLNHETIDDSKDIRNYILVAVRNEVNGHLRRIHKKRYEELINEIPDETAGPETRMSDGAMIRDISTAISRMPDRRREVFSLSRDEGLSNKEIAERLGLSVRTVEKHIENALSDLKHRFPVS